jgi:hypothetical protein
VKDYGVYEKRMLREIFRPETEEEVGGWRKLHSEDLQNLFSIYCL